MSTLARGWLLPLALLAWPACGSDPAVSSDGGTGSGDSEGESTGGSETGGTDATGSAGMVCTPGQRVCGDAEVLECPADGSMWVSEPCGAGEVCLDGACESTTLAVDTEVLPPAVLGFDYAIELDAVGGVPPYAWGVGDGEVPPGLMVDAEGLISGTPESPADYVFEAVVTDDAGGEAARAFSLTVHPEPLTVITPPDLGAVDEGVPMSKPLVALGGVPAYGWFVVGGALPAGAFVDSTGSLDGTPTEAGLFDFRLRVVDAQRPPGWAEQEFQLSVDLRPLEIVADEKLDLLAFKVVILPLLTIIPGVPVPYSTQLEATGGQQPYAWSEQPTPGALQALFPQAGVPTGLMLDPDGTVSGAVTETDQVITVNIPLSPISLTGFFFFAQVADSQEPSETAEAMFLIPTLPVGG